MIREILDVTTVMLAFIAMIACLDRVVSIKRNYLRRFFVVATFASALLLVCQTSWLMTFMAGLDISPDTTNLAWDVFNSTVALSYIYLAWTTRRK